jgi:hypothetical protein
VGVAGRRSGDWGVRLEWGRKRRRNPLALVHAYTYTHTPLYRRRPAGTPPCADTHTHSLSLSLSLSSSSGHGSRHGRPGRAQRAAQLSTPPPRLPGTRATRPTGSWFLGTGAAGRRRTTTPARWSTHSGPPGAGSGPDRRQSQAHSAREVCVCGGGGEAEAAANDTHTGCGQPPRMCGGGGGCAPSGHRGGLHTDATVSRNATHLQDQVGQAKLDAVSVPTQAIVADPSLVRRQHVRAAATEGQHARATTTTPVRALMVTLRNRTRGTNDQQ